MEQAYETAGHQTRDSVEDIWGPRTPYKHQWPTRVDANYIEEPEKWVQSACVLCRYAIMLLAQRRGLQLLQMRR
jgi:ferredoxin-nitrate reductase